LSAYPLFSAPCTLSSAPFPGAPHLDSGVYAVCGATGYREIRTTKAERTQRFFVGNYDPGFPVEGRPIGPEPASVR